MKQRIITGVVAAVLFIPIVLYGNLPFEFLVYLLATVGVFELIRMNKAVRSFIAPKIISFALLWILMIPDHFAENFKTISIMELKWNAVIIALFALLIYTVLSKNSFQFEEAAFLLLTAIYVGIGFYYFIETRSEGAMYVFYALFTIWATDSGAYFVGKSVGKRKLWPDISPNKTIEGSVGGIIIAVIIAFVFKVSTGWEISFLLLALITIIVSVVGQLGDLVQSAYKRYYGVKDSGNILPGHGGILDRFDSLLFVLPILHFLPLF